MRAAGMAASAKVRETVAYERAGPCGKRTRYIPRIGILHQVEPPQLLAAGGDQDGSADCSEREDVLVAMAELVEMEVVIAAMRAVGTVVMEVVMEVMSAVEAAGEAGTLVLQGAGGVLARSGSGQEGASRVAREPRRLTRARGKTLERAEETAAKRAVTETGTGS